MKPLGKSLGAPALFGIVQGFVAASVYFAVGLVAQRALGFTWLVFLTGGLLFACVVVSYVEGASLHQERGGVTVIARFAFNELVSFVAGWAICLEYVILIAICAFATTDYAAVFWQELDAGAPEFAMAATLVAFVAWWNARGSAAPTYTRGVLVVARRPCPPALIVGFGVAYLVEPELLTDPASVAGTPSLEDLMFVFPLVLVAFSGLDASSGLAGQVAIGRRGLRRLIAVRMLAALVPYVGIAVVASATLPRESGRWLEAPLLGVVEAFPQELAARAAALHRRRLGGGHPRRRLQRGDARRLPAGLLAGPQPADPVANRLPAPAARDAGGHHRHRRRAGRPAPADRRPRVPARHLGLRGNGSVHARLPVGVPPALARARPRPPLPDAAQPAAARRLAAGARRARRRDLRRGVRQRARVPRRRPLGRPGLDGVRRARLRLLPAVRGQAAAQAHHRARAGAHARGAPRPSTARSSCPSSAPRSTTTSCRRPAGWPPRRTTSSRRAAP